MDMSLFHRPNIAARGRSVARIDYHVLVATLQALQIATATAKAQSRCTGGHSGPVHPRAEPLAEILLGSHAWEEAVLAQGGSFNPGVAQDRI